MRMSFGVAVEPRHVLVVREDGDVGQQRLVGAQVELSRHQPLPPGGIDERADAHAPRRAVRIGEVDGRRVGGDLDRR
jgi:hypothetical protein